MDVMRMLAVLAFAFLSFAHQPVPLERYGASDAVTVAVFCGSGLGGDPADTHDRDERLCDACRIVTAIALPEPPVLAEPVLQSLGTAVAAGPRFALAHAPLLAGHGPRAPPAVIPV